MYIHNHFGGHIGLFDINFVSVIVSKRTVSGNSVGGCLGNRSSIYLSDFSLSSEVNGNIDNSLFLIGFANGFYVTRIKRQCKFNFFSPTSIIAFVKFDFFQEISRWILNIIHEI